MSGRTQTPLGLVAPVPKFLLALSLLFAAVGVVGLRADDADPKSPRPPVRVKRSVAIDKNKAIFLGRFDAKNTRIENTGIVDRKPIAAEAPDKANPARYANSDEYQAWTAVVQHARQFAQDEIEEAAARDLTRDDLTMGNYEAHRLDPVRLDGKVTRVRRVEGSQGLKLEGTPEWYEALLVPLGEPTPDDWAATLDWSVSVVFTELPAAFDAVRQKPFGEWLEVDTWAAAAGFFFKVVRDGEGEPEMPVLIGRSVRVLKVEPRPPGPNPAALDRELRVFRLIENDATIARGHNNWEEVSAWNRVLLHARRFTPEELEKYAGEVSFATLFNDGRREVKLPDLKRPGFDYRGRRDYKLDLLKFEGWLVKVERLKPSNKLRAAGLEAAYEGWIVPREEEESGNPICVVFTDPPDGAEPTAAEKKWVSFAGYSFKLLQYKSAERDKDDPTKNVTKRAPLLLGRAVTVRPPPATPPVSWRHFVTAAVVVVGGLLAFVLVVGWWYRRGDHRARREIDAHRIRNPFGD